MSDLFIVLLFVYDCIRSGRPPRATVLGSLLLVFSHPLRFVIGNTHVWLVFANWFSQLGSLISPILIIGGTRGTGLLIAKLLAQHGSSVRVLARDPASAKRRLGAGVQIVAGDITKAETLPGAIKDAKHIIFTAGCRSGRPATEAQIKSTEYEGVLNVIACAQAASFRGRFMYMTASGVSSQSWMATCLNLYKGNTLRWRRRAEEAIRESGLDYTIIRTGILQNRGGGTCAIKITQQALLLSLQYRIARADVAQVFVQAMEHPNASCATFEITWSAAAQSEPWTKLLETLKPDA